MFTPSPSVSVCIPAYNEEASIESAIGQIRAVLEKIGCEYEIIICDDASSDRTGVIIRKLTMTDPRLRAIFHEENKGIRATFEELYAAAGKDTVFLIPSDLEWPPEILPALLKAYADADIVIASRIDKHYAATRELISMLFNLAPYLLFGVKVRDAGAVKLVRRDIIQRVRLISLSPFSEAERIIRASRLGYKVASLPTVTRRRKSGVSHGVNLKVVAQAIADVARVWWDIRVRGTQK